jgi:hypothetical protein
MTDRNAERERERADSGTTGPVGTMFGAAFGPFGAAVGSVVDANRVAFTFSFGTGVPGSSGRSEDDGLRDAATIEIEGTGQDQDASEDGEEEHA